jgi:hypothetical protein
MQFRWQSFDLAHVAMVDGRHVTIGPGVRDGIPSRFADSTAVSGIALPTYSIVLFEFLGFRCGDALPQ